MHWVVDAMNVIGARPTGWWRDRAGAVMKLHAALRAFVIRTGDAVTLVVDGRPIAELPEGEDHGVHVLYAARPGPDAADDRIIDWLSRRNERGGLCLVSSDRHLRDRAAALGVPGRGAGAFLQQLADAGIVMADASSPGRQDFGR